MSTPPHITIKGLSKTFGSNRVLSDVNLDIPPKESIVIIGGSGTGKSVLTKIICTLLYPDSGAVLIDGTNIFTMNKNENRQTLSKFGMLFQGAALFDSLNIWENIAFGLINGQKFDRKAAKKIALAKLDDVGLPNRVADLYPSELSGGMKKRVGLARAIAGDPQVIFFDEPTTGLDPIMSNVINELIVSCVKKVGATAITITHDMNSVRHIASKVAMLHAGSIVWQGNIKEMDYTDNAFVQQFINGLIKGPMTADHDLECDKNSI
jgi:phospholipid/cholesterol/gamma-HCH transport system ATP-binding protein